MNIKDSADIKEEFKRDIKAMNLGYKITLRERHYKSYEITVYDYGFNLVKTEKLTEYDLNNGKTINVYKAYKAHDDLTDKGIEVISKVLSAMTKNYWDESDIQTDYHHSAFYYGLTIKFKK